MAMLLHVARRSCAAVVPSRSLGAAARGRHYSTLLLAEHDEKGLSKATFQVATAAAKLPGSTKLDVLLMGKGAEAAAKEAAGLKGVSRVLFAESDQLANPVADTASQMLLSLQSSNSYGAITGASSSICKEVLPRVAAKLDVQPVTDIIEVGDEEGVFSRPMYAGNAIQTVKSTDSVKVLTFRPTAFEAQTADNNAPVEPLAAAKYDSCGLEWVSNSEKSSDKPQLSSASRSFRWARLEERREFRKVLRAIMRQAQCGDGCLACCR